MLSNRKAQLLKSRTTLLRVSIRKSKLRFIVLCLLFIGLFFKRREIPTAIVYTLTPEQVYVNSSPEQVLRVLREKRFSSRADLREPLVEVRSFKTFLTPNPNFTYDAPIYILHKVLGRWTYSRVFREINKEISSLDDYSVFNIKKFKECLFDPIVYSLLFSRQASTIDLITTQSSFFKIPSAFKSANASKKIMAWYSTNSKPIYASDDLLRKRIDVNAFKDYVNEHWVWNEEEVVFLESHGLKNVISTGAVVFQDRDIVEKNLNKFVITYFDVTPVQGSGGFYSENNTSLVLTSVLQLVDSINSKYEGKTEVRMKPKRKYSKIHSKVYTSEISRLLRSQKIIVLPASANLYKTISQSDLVLAIPFTSSALLAKELNVDSLFVSIGIEGWDIPRSSDGIPVITQFEELLNHVEGEIESKFNL